MARRLRAETPQGVAGSRKEGRKSSMTNEEIIYKASVDAGIFTEKEASEFFKKGWELPIHTFSEWKKYGYSVKKGEHAALTVRLWRKRIAKLIEKDSGEEVEADSGYYMTTAHLFTGAQVEKIKTA